MRDDESWKRGVANNIKRTTDRIRMGLQHLRNNHFHGTGTFNGPLVLVQGPE